jgi:hypothetical protein
MILTHEVIKYNLDLLEEIKSEFPILGDYHLGKVSRESVMGIGFDDIVYFIDYIERVKSSGQSLIYETSPEFKEIKSKIVETSYSAKSKSIFKNKSKNDFIQIFKDHKLHRRYMRGSNSCYTEGLETCEPIIINFFVFNQIDFETNLLRNRYFTTKLIKPQLFARELKKTQEFVSCFLSYAHDQDFDLRKCNIKSLTNELNSKLKQLMFIEPGLRVKSLVQSKSLTENYEYEVIDSRVNYLGYLEVKIVDNQGHTGFHPYSNFEEKSRERHDIIRELGI